MYKKTGLLVDLRNKGLVRHGGPHIPLLGNGRKVDLLVLDLLVRDHGEQVMNGIEPGPPLVVGINYKPGCSFGIGIGEHLVLGLAVFDPPAPGFQVHGAEFPTLQGVGDSLSEPGFLLFIAYREPVFDQDNPGMNQHFLEAGT